MGISNRKLGIGIWSSEGKGRYRVIYMRVTACPSFKAMDQIKLIKERIREKRKLRIKLRYSEESSARD